MNCKYCGAAIVQEKASKRIREYCKDACKQADYRRRHKVGATTQLEKELEDARQRIAELERLVTKLQQGQRVKRNVMVTIEPVELGKFADLHGIARDHARMGFYEYRHTHKWQPYELDDSHLLDAHEQRVFYERNRNYGYTWRECEACPHEEHEDTSMTRKRPESRPTRLKIDLPKECILAHDFAKMHGVPWGTFRDHMTKGIGRGLPPEQKDKVAACERPKAGRANETERYLTQEQQRAALEYWQRHGVKFT